jgi:hypothetical protein
MALTLQVDHYESLEQLSADIAQAAKDNPQQIYEIETPMKIELSEKNYDKVTHDLKAHGSYAGLRTESEFMVNQWNVSGVQVSFIKAK